MSKIERRTAARLNLTIPLRFRPITNPATPEQSAETVNLSRRGVCFSTAFPLRVGTPIELLLKMPRELTGKAATEVRCTARVVHIQPELSVGGKAGIGAQIERYEALQSGESWAD